MKETRGYWLKHEFPQATSEVDTHSHQSNNYSTDKTLESKPGGPARVTRVNRVEAHTCREGGRVEVIELTMEYSVRKEQVPGRARVIQTRELQVIAVRRYGTARYSKPS